MLEDFFTDEELSAIESMCRDYADYGDEQAEIADSIIAKIYTHQDMLEVWIAIFCLMATNYALSIFGLSL